jgi:murein DD-endopeptidase MepM/ murein hydrolase activator NlpD
VRNARIRAVSVLIVLAAGVVPTTAADGVPTKTDPRVQQLQEAIGEASADEAAALRELSGIRSRRQDLDAAVAQFDAQVRAVEARIGALQAQIDELTARAVDLENQAAAARGQLDEAKRRASAAAAAMYRSDDLASMYADMLDVDDVNQIASGSKYLRHISDLRQTQVAALAGLKLQIETLQQEADAQRKQVSDAQAQARQERAEIAGLRAEQQQKRDAAAGEEAHEQTLVASIRSQKDKFNAQLSSLQAASNAARALLAAKQRGQARGSSFHVRRPVPGAITDGFGPRVHPILGTVRIHTGVDMHAAQGEPIHAAAAGVVAFAGVKGGYGNAVIIDHGGQFATLYGHSSKLLVSTGQKVSAGQVIALVGATGQATGPHLHFEVRILGVPVNPVPYL